MKVIVTGAAGLYGVHLVDELVKREDILKVYGLDNFSRSYFEESPFIASPEFDSKFELLRQDYCRLTTKDLDRLDVDAVIHLAAYISIPESMEREEEYFHNNEYGTFRLMQALVRTRKWPVMVYASSPEVYGNPIYTPMDIYHPMLPRSIYAVTKLAAEKHCRAMYEWYKYPVVIIRNFNTFGENQDISGNAGVVSAFIIRALKNEPISIHDSGEQTRDFQYVKDAARAYSLVLKKGNPLAGEVFNIGTGLQTSIKGLAEIIIDMTGSRSEIRLKPGRKADLMSLEADYHEIQNKAGWEPRHTLKDGLERTINWYKRFIR